MQVSYIYTVQLECQLGSNKVIIGCKVARLRTCRRKDKGTQKAMLGLTGCFSTL